MTPAEQAMAAAWLAECWPVCREVSREERVQKRKDDRAEQRHIEELSTGICGSPVDDQSTKMWTEAG